MNCYRQAEHDLLGYLAERARQEAGRLGTDPAHAAVQAAMRAQAAEHLVAINTLRQLAGHAKRGCVTTWVRQRIAAGEKVMIAAHHRGEVDHYASQFGGLKLQGGQPVAGKEAAKAAFQHQPAAQAPVIAVAIGAGGVGHTLTAAAIGIQAEQAWTPGETQQMKKRLHRIGQDRQGLTGTPPAKAHQQDGPQNGEARQDNQPTGPGQAIVRRQEIPGSGIVWTWHGTTGFVTHELRTELPDGATWWTIWAGDIPGRPGLVFSHAKSDEAEAQVESLRATEADKLAANRFLRSLGYTATEHAPTRADCNCDDCQPPPEATASAGPADGAPGQARSREAAAGPGPAAEGRSAGTTAGRALRQAAHFYLGHGLLPVPAWAARADGSCCCPRGADCPRPGKHPRSVHAGPGERDYSWKPLACRTHEEVEQRFAAGGRYADANLMVAIPPGMLVVDQDDDDGGPQAIATLAAQLGDLPPTLAHRTPHGVHRIYRTPPGWTGRAWVGKDARNPLPAGIDLRVPGQILMAAPSQVPALGGMAGYGPVSGTAIAELPAAYLAAWTPPQTQPARPRRPVPVPPDRSAAAARYVHAKVEGIIDDLAAHEPGGRNAAIYHAALKVGSTLGAARTTPGAGHAAGEWTDQAAENALIEAAEINGYVAKHGYAAARSAIRSGLRNGLRDPWPLPDFAAQPTPPSPAASRARRREPGQGNTSPARVTPSAQARDASPQAGAAGPENARPVPSADGTVLEEQGNQGGPAAPTAATTPGRGRSTRTRSAGQAPAAQAQEAATRPAGPGPEAVTHGTPGVRRVSAVLGAAGFVASSEALQAVHVPEGYQVQATLEGGIQISHIAIDEPVNGVSPTARTERMLTGYAYALQAAGFHVTSPARETLIVQPGARQAAPGGERARQPGPAKPR
jgi:hypothetical protein